VGTGRRRECLHPLSHGDDVVFGKGLPRREQLQDVQELGARHEHEKIGPVADFQLESPYVPSGDQPKAIEGLVESVHSGERFTTLLGATGTGKTFTVSHVVAALNRPTIVLAPNKSLAAQLANEFREFFPKNRVEYFV